MTTSPCKFILSSDEIKLAGSTLNSDLAEVLSLENSRLMAEVSL